jgi:NAD-dependent DNA ligase
MDAENKVSTEEVERLEKLIDEANIAYRTGNNLVSDLIYDGWIDELTELDPTNERLEKIGFVPADDGRMQILPVPMASMNKIKTIDDFKKWIASKSISGRELMVLTPKYDGLSFCVDERNGKDAWSRGDGIKGQYSPGHYELIVHSNNELLHERADFYAIGEVIMPRKTFLENKFLKDDGVPFSNPRNLVAGKINDKKPNELLKHCVYIRYGLYSELSFYKRNKSVQLEILNQLNPVKLI